MSAFLDRYDIDFEFDQLLWARDVIDGHKVYISVTEDGYPADDRGMENTRKPFLVYRDELDDIMDRGRDRGGRDRVSRDRGGRDRVSRDRGGRDRVSRDRVSRDDGDRRRPTSRIGSDRNSGRSRANDSVSNSRDTRKETEVIEEKTPTNNNQNVTALPMIGHEYPYLVMYGQKLVKEIVYGDVNRYMYTVIDDEEELMSLSEDIKKNMQLYNGQQKVGLDANDDIPFVKYNEVHNFDSGSFYRHLQSKILNDDIGDNIILECDMSYEFILETSDEARLYLARMFDDVNEIDDLIKNMRRGIDTGGYKKLATLGLDKLLTNAVNDMFRLRLGSTWTIDSFVSDGIELKKVFNEISDIRLRNRHSVGLKNILTYFQYNAGVILSDEESKRKGKNKYDYTSFRLRTTVLYVSDKNILTELYKADNKTPMLIVKEVTMSLFYAITLAYTETSRHNIMILSNDGGKWSVNRTEIGFTILKI